MMTTQRGLVFDGRRLAMSGSSGNFVAGFLGKCRNWLPGGYAISLKVERIMLFSLSQGELSPAA